MEIKPPFVVEGFGQIVQQTRKRKGMSAANLSEAMGISTHHLSEIENAHGNPSADLMVALTRFLGIDANSFFYPNLDNESVKRKQVIHTIQTIDESYLDAVLAFLEKLPPSDS